MSKPTQQDLVKLYYRIGEVSQIVGVQPHVLRYWESEFRTIRPQKSSKGQRVYSRKDVEKLLRVKDLLKNQGFTIAGARKQLTRQGIHDGVAAEVSEQVPAEANAAPQPLAARSNVAPVSSRHEAKALRRTLVQIRSEIVEMLDELDAYGRPEV